MEGVTWTKVIHDNEGHPDVGTLPDDGALVDFVRVQTMLTDGIDRWYHIRGICRRFYDPGYGGCANAQVNGDATVLDSEPPDGYPTEEGIYWRLAESSESATLQS